MSDLPLHEPLSRNQATKEYPLHKAAEEGDINQLEALLEKFPKSINALNPQRIAILHIAAEEGHTAMVDMLLQKPGILNLIKKIAMAIQHLPKQLHKSIALLCKA